MAERRSPLGCCLLILLLVVVPLIGLAVAVWLLLRARKRITGEIQQRFGIELPDGWLTSLPGAAYGVYREIMAELDADRERDA